MNIIKDVVIDYLNAQHAYDHCRDIILKNKGQKKFYVGATKDLDERAKDHLDEKGMTNMIVLCKCPTKCKTESLEKKLIKRFNSDSIYNKCINQTGGGERLKDGVNYIYVLFN